MLGIICAMEVELNGVITLMKDVYHEKRLCYEFTFGTIRGKKVVAALSGIGKVNAAAVTALIVDLGANEIINLGVCGGTIKAGSVIVAESVVQYDFDTTAFGDELGKVDGFDSPYIKCAESVYGKIEGVKGVIASGDKFISDREFAKYLSEKFGAIGFDMESGAVAQICAKCGIPFAVIRVVSDGGDATEYENLKTLAAKRAVLTIDEYLK